MECHSKCLCYKCNVRLTKIKNYSLGPWNIWLPTHFRYSVKTNKKSNQSKNVNRNRKMNECEKTKTGWRWWFTLIDTSFNLNESFRKALDFSWQFKVCIYLWVCTDFLRFSCMQVQQPLKLVLGLSRKVQQRTMPPIWIGILKRDCVFW